MATMRARRNNGGSTGKAEEESGGERRQRLGFKTRPGRTKKPRSSLLLASAKPKVATSAPGSQKKLAVGEVSPTGTIHNIYRIATRLISQITPKFVW